MTASLLFPLDEYQQRLSTVRAHMRARDIDLLLVDQTEFLFHLTGFGLSLNMYRACLVPLEGDPVMIFRAIDQSTFEENSWMSEMVVFSDWEDPLAVIARTIEANGWKGMRLGVDRDSYCMTLNRYEKLKALLPWATWQDFSGVLEQVRECKSAREIAYIREAGRMGDVAFDAVLRETGVGRTERQAAATVHRVFMEMGGDTTRCGIITAGVGNSFLHGNLHDRPLDAGDVLHLELLPFMKGYSARLMRPVVIGKASAEQQQLSERLVAIQDDQFAAMRPGAAARDIDAIAREAMLAEGLRDSYVNITGYTLGYYPISTPHTSDFSRVFLSDATWKLKEGMVFHMYVSASGIAFSETIAVTASGCERLTLAPRKLFVA